MAREYFCNAIRSDVLRVWADGSEGFGFQTNDGSTVFLRRPQIENLIELLREGFPDQQQQELPGWRDVP